MAEPVGVLACHASAATMVDVEPNLARRHTVVLVGASRVHWMLGSGNDVPDGYVNFLWANRPCCDDVIRRQHRDAP